ncbi:MAG: hypothetical protein MI923_13325 [Phycisphaerales bacterium]|nr:hypothetical protein [Phycisphaerales bacterium]
MFGRKKRIAQLEQQIKRLEDIIEDQDYNYKAELFNQRENFKEILKVISEEKEQLRRDNRFLFDKILNSGQDSQEVTNRLAGGQAAKELEQFKANKEQEKPPGAVDASSFLSQFEAAHGAALNPTSVIIEQQEQPADSIGVQELLNAGVKEN